MTRRFKPSLGLAAACVLLMGFRARADTFSSIQSGAWSSPASWLNLSAPLGGGYPQAGDTAIVNALHVVTLVQDENTQTLIVNALGAVHVGGQTLALTGAGGLIMKSVLQLKSDIEIGPGGSLELTGGGTSLVAGDICLEGFAAELRASGSQTTLAGDGQIIGEHQDARMVASGDSTLTVGDGLTIKGQLQFVGLPGTAHDGRLENNGTVECNVASGSLKLASGEVAGSGRFNVSANDAVLQIAAGVTATGLAADFLISNGGILDVNANVTTSGDLKQFTDFGSKIEVAGGVSIKFGQ